jgi:uncharacterized membrane protein
MNPARRFWEVDFLRGIAICMMVASNAVTDLQYFTGYAGLGAFWFWFARATASLFLLLAGVSLTLSYSRAAASGAAGFPKFLRRGLWIFWWGLAITAVTWLFLGSDLVLFGVLHLIGISIIISYPLIKRKLASLAAGIAAIAAGLGLQATSFGFPWLLWLGLMPSGYRSVDYFPLLPWFGVVLVGISLGNILYAGGKRKFKMRMHENEATGLLSFLGRHSLVIYLLHQPVILSILWAAGIIRI